MVGDAWERRGREMGGVGRLHEPRSQEYGGAPVVSEAGLDEFDGASGPDDRDDGFDHVEGDRAEDVVGQAADYQAIAAARVAVTLDGMCQ